MKENCSLEDIEKYLEELEKRNAKLLELKEKLLNVPLLGWNLYTKAVRIETEIKLLKEDLEIARNSSLEKQEQLIKRYSSQLSKYN